jgi:hypothetical protein
MRIIDNGKPIGMTNQSSLIGSPVPQKQAVAPIVLHTPKEAARLLKFNLSWLAKARMRGDGAALHPDWSVGSLCRGRSGPVDEVPAALVDERAVVVAGPDSAEGVSGLSLCGS